MLKRINRLKKNSAFTATYKLNKTFGNKNFIMYVGRVKEDAEIHTKIGFVVSKKVHKRAVKRNRTKRLMREVLRLTIKDNRYPNIHNHLSLIFIAKTNAINLNFTEVQHDICSLLEKID